MLLVEAGGGEERAAGEGEAKGIENNRSTYCERGVTVA